MFNFIRGGCGYGSESEGEEPDDSKVTLPQNLHGRGNVKSQQSAVRLTEVSMSYGITCLLKGFFFFWPG